MNDEIRLDPEFVAKANRLIQQLLKRSAADDDTLLITEQVMELYRSGRIPPYVAAVLMAAVHYTLDLGSKATAHDYESLHESLHEFLGSSQ